MNQRFRRLNVMAWPLWLKLSAGFLVAVLVPLVLAFLAIQNSLRDVGLQNLRLFISENGNRQQQAIVNVLAQARDNIDAFLGDAPYEFSITNLLLANTPLVNNSVTTPVDETEVTTIFRDVLLNRSTTLFDNVRLLDRNGTLVTDATAGTTAESNPEANQSRTAAYQALLNEQVKAQGRDQIVVVSTSEDGQPVIEIANILRWRNGRPIGYLIAQLNTARSIYDRLNFQDSQYGAYSFVVSNDTEVVMTPLRFLDTATAASNSNAVRRALSGEVGLEVYRTSANGPEVVGYFAPIPDTSMALIAEVSTDYAAIQGRSYLDVRAFVIGIAMLALVVVMTAVFNQAVTPPLTRLRQAAESIMAGKFDEPVADVNRGDEIGALAASFVNMRDQVQSLIEDLEARIAIRTRDIAATQEISRYAASQRDVQTLMDKVVNLIIERFQSIYHAQIFLVDADRRYAVLRASTGAVGRELIARGHRLAVGSVSVIGQVTSQGRVVTARDTVTSTIHRRNEFLPDTAAELAIPLSIGDEIIGALDVQSKQRDAFTQDLTNVLQTMGDQIAIAIQNARFYQESVRRLEEIEHSNRIATLAVWQEYMRDLRARRLVSEAGTANIDLSPLRQQAIDTGKIAAGSLTARNTIPVAVPIVLRGQTLGAVEWELPAKEVDENKLLLAQELANRLAISLDNARLFEESQRATERERVVNTIAAKLTAQTDIDQILQTAVREVGQALRAPGVTIRLRNTSEEDLYSDNGHTNGNGNGTGHSNGNGTLP